MFWKKYISEQNDEILSEIMPSFRTEAVEDRDVIFNKIQVSYIKFPHLMNVQMLFLWLKSVFLMHNKWFEVWQFMFKHPVYYKTPRQKCKIPSTGWAFFGLPCCPPTGVLCRDCNVGGLDDAFLGGTGVLYGLRIRQLAFFSFLDFVGGIRINVYQNK